MKADKKTLNKAASLYERFHGEPADLQHIVDIPDSPAGVVIGYLDAVVYTTVRDGKTRSYRHVFKKRARPLLCASATGEQLLVVGGEFFFGENGIEDK